MIKKDIFIGILVGLIANAIGLFLASTLLGKDDDFTTVIKAASNEGFLVHCATVCVVFMFEANFVRRVPLHKRYIGAPV